MKSLIILVMFNNDGGDSVDDDLQVHLMTQA